MKIFLISLALIINYLATAQYSSISHATELFQNIKYNNKGILLGNDQINTAYKGEGYTHIFFDEFGNIILSSLPQGRSNHRYVAHIFYQEIKDNPDFINYSIIGEGDFDPTLTIYNQGNLKNIDIKAAHNDRNGQGDAQRIVFVSKHLEFLMPVATSQLKISIFKNISDGTNLQKTTLSAYNIKMTPNFHVALNLGLLKSSLANPTFTLLDSNIDITKKTVKREEENSRSQLSAFVTFYYSPIKMIKNLANNTKSEILAGRNFLDDDKFFERIYPTIGIKLGEKSLENFFYGLNWEIVRGGGIFVGRQYGRVNNFDLTDNLNFKFGSSFMTQEEFNIRNSKSWKTNWVFGATIDLSIASEFFKSK